MLVIEAGRWALRQLAAIPFLALVGVVVMGVGALADVVVHLGLPQEHAAGGGVHLEEHLAHLVGVVGMGLTWAGVVLDGAFRQLRGHNAAQERSSVHADR